MAVFIVRRLVQGFLVLFVATLTIYTIFIVAPGGPADQIQAFRMTQTSNRQVSTEYIKALEEQYNVDKPWPLNYAAWLFNPDKTTKLDVATGTVVQRGIDINLFGWHIAGSGVLTGDLGDSLKITTGVSVMDLLGDRIVNTLILTTSSLLFSVLIAFPIGIISAIKQYSKLDYSVTTFSFLGLSMPTFWLGLMLIILLSNLPSQLHWNSGWRWHHTSRQVMSPIYPNCLVILPTACITWYFPLLCSPS